jgi:hypothetical protein
MARKEEKLCEEYTPHRFEVAQQLHLVESSNGFDALHRRLLGRAPGAVEASA